MTLKDWLFFAAGVYVMIHGAGAIITQRMTLRNDITSREFVFEGGSVIVWGSAWIVFGTAMVYVALFADPAAKLVIYDHLGFAR